MSTETMDTFLPPIQKPEGLMLKLTHYFTRRRFGKVLTPLKVYRSLGGGLARRAEKLVE